MITTLTSVTGAPGTTTTALALAHAWPRPTVIVEHATGSPILAGFGRGQIPHDRSAARLIDGFRSDSWAQAIESASIELAEDIRLIPGATTVDANATSGMWEPLVDPLLAHCQERRWDIIVDAGRFPSQAFPNALLAVSDHVVVVTGSTLVDVACTSRAVPALGRSANGTVRAIAVGKPNPYRPAQLESVLNVPVTVLPNDPKAASVFRGKEPGRNHEKSALMRAVRDLAQQLTVVDAPSDTQEVLANA